jgi:sugar lactone lactonase YvrE
VSKSPNRVLVIVIGLIVVAFAIVTVLSSTKSAVVLDRATPAGSVQAYLKAILVGKNAEAAKLLSPDSVCTVTDIDRAYVVDTARVVLVDSTVKRATAEVRVRVEIPSGSPLGDVMTEDHTFRLVNSEGAWLVTGIPWPLFDCGVSAK